MKRLGINVVTPSIKLVLMNDGAIERKLPR